MGGLRAPVADGPSTRIFAGGVGTGSFPWLGIAGRIVERPDGLPQVQGLPMSILWWLVLSALASWIVPRTRTGNGIVASGGDAEATRDVGMRVRQLEIGPFVTTAVRATIFACVQARSVGWADLVRGELEEFEAVIASVIGGCLPTAGYGVAIGASFGALVFGTVQQGIV